MNSASFFVQRRSAVCVAFLMMTGCGSPQVQTTPLVPTSQNLVSTGVQPAIDCPIVGKTYTRSDGNGQASVKFQEAYAKAGTYPTDLRTRVVYSHWPQNRPTIYRKFTMGTCGLESGKKPLGQARESGGSSEMKCVDGVCTLTLNIEIAYTPPATVPGGKGGNSTSFATLLISRRRASIRAGFRTS